MRLFGMVALAVAVWPASSRADWFCSANEPWRQPVERLFSAHDDTYIITGIPSSRTDPKQVKFQFSFKFDLTPNEGPCGLFFAYTQRSLWNAYALSSPFEDTSYNPQLFLTFGRSPAERDVAGLERALPAEAEWRAILEAEGTGPGCLEVHWRKAVPATGERC